MHVMGWHRDLAGSLHCRRLGADTAGGDTIF
jgi:hypothetical protein